MTQGREKKHSRGEAGGGAARPGAFLPAGSFLPDALDKREKTKDTFPGTCRGEMLLEQGWWQKRLEATLCPGEKAAHPAAPGRGTTGCLGQCFAKQTFALWYWRLNLQHEQRYCASSVLTRELFPSGAWQQLSPRSAVGRAGDPDPDTRACVHGPAKDKPYGAGPVRWPGERPPRDSKKLDKARPATATLRG